MTETDPPSPCQCRHCLQDNGAVRGKELLSHKPATRKPTKSTLSRLPPNRRPSMKLSGTVHSPKDTAGDPPRRAQRPVIADGQTILARVRVAVPSADVVNPHSANSWPILHELVWCKLWRPIAWAELLIDFWPGIIKEDIDGSNEYVMTLIGVTHNVSISLDDMVPYRAYRIEETLVHGVQRCCRRETRVRLLNLDRYLRAELDDNRFAAVSSAFLFAIAFSEHLATVWSWTSKSNIADSGSVVAAPSKSRYALRSQRSKEQYNVLWWGPECVESRQLVRLKMSHDALSINEDVWAAASSSSVGSERPIFLQVHSISHWLKSQRMGRSLAGPVVAGMIFELVDENQCCE